MQLPELQQAIQKLLDDAGYQLEIKQTPAHPTFYILDSTVKDLILSTIKFDVAIVKKITTNEIPRP